MLWSADNLSASFDQPWMASVRLRSCPPPCGLLLYLAKPHTDHPRLRYAFDVRGAKHAPLNRSVGRSAQRHKGRGRRPGDSRGAECAADLFLQTSWQDNLDCVDLR